MSSDNQSLLTDDVRIVYRAEGTAAVNGVPVPVEPGEDVRDAAYRVAVGMIAAAGATGPVVATSIEADGAEYRITLYPSALAVAGTSRAGARTAIGAGAEAVGALGRVRRAWYRPTFNLSWLAAAACACVLLSVLVTVLLHEHGPSVVRLSVDTESEAGHSAAAQAGRAIAVLPNATVPPSARKSPKPTASPTPSRSRTAAVLTAAPVPETSKTIPSVAPGPKPKPRSGTAAPASVSNLTLTLIGGDQSGSSIAYLVSMSTSTTAPITLTYYYSGNHGRAAVTRSVPLSGSRSYMFANLIPAQLYCGGPLTMKVWTNPWASNGSVTASAQPGC